jgi:steroid delta-isomerase-like uncharacterized protein
MTVEENLKTIKILDQVFKRRDWNAFDDLHTQDVITYSPMTPEPSKGIAAHKEALQGILKAFPDIEMKIERSFGQDDWVFASYTFYGTHKGPLPGPDGKPIPPTNNPIKISFASTLRFENGKIAEEHTYFDRLAMMAQLGINP